MSRASKVVAWLLFLCSAVFGLISLITVIRAINEAATWKSIDAVVADLAVHPVARNRFGVIEIRFRYSTGSTNVFASAQTTGLPFGEGESLTRRYRIGSRHRIRIDPDDSTKAEIDMGWNLQFLFVPVISAVACALLFVGGRYYLRLGSSGQPPTANAVEHTA